MEQIEAKHVIIGAGAMGSAAAYHLARRGEPVMLSNSLRWDTTAAARTVPRGSRGTRTPTRLRPDDARGVSCVEGARGRRRRGVVRPDRRSLVLARRASITRRGSPPTSPSSMSRTGVVPAGTGTIGIPRSACPATYDVVFEPDAGMIKAARAVALAGRAGPALRRGPHASSRRRPPSSASTWKATRPVVVTDTAAIDADRLIVAAGAWVKRLLPRLAVPLTATRQQVLYLRADDPAPFRVGRFPVFIFKGSRRR